MQWCRSRNMLCDVNTLCMRGFWGESRGFDALLREALLAFVLGAVLDRLRRG